MTSSADKKPQLKRIEVGETETMNPLERFSVWLGNSACDILNWKNENDEAIKKFQSQRQSSAMAEAFQLGFVHGRIAERHELLTHLSPLFSAEIKRTAAISRANANKEVAAGERAEIQALNAELAIAIPKPSLRYREIASRLTNKTRTTKETRVRYIIEGPRKSKKKKG